MVHTTSVFDIVSRIIEPYSISSGIVLETPATLIESLVVRKNVGATEKLAATVTSFQVLPNTFLVDENSFPSIDRSDILNVENYVKDLQKSLNNNAKRPTSFVRQKTFDGKPIYLVYIRRKLFYAFLILKLISYMCFFFYLSYLTVGRSRKRLSFAWRNSRFQHYSQSVLTEW